MPTVDENNQRFKLSDNIFEIVSRDETEVRKLDWEECIVIGNALYDRKFYKTVDRQHSIRWRHPEGEVVFDEHFISDIEYRNFLKNNPDFIIIQHMSRPVGEWVSEDDGLV